MESSVDISDVVGNGSSPSSKAYLSENEMDVLAVITLFTGGLSLIGASSVFLCSLINGRVCYPEIFPTFHLSLADMLSSLFLVVSSSIFLLSQMSYPGAPGPCGYIMTMVTCFYTTAFLLTIAYAIEALFRFRRRLTDGMRLDAVNVRVVSNNWMYLVYGLCWLLPLGLATGLMLVTHNLKDIEDNTVWLTIMPKQCTSCFPNFRFNEEMCWSQVVDGGAKHKMIRLLFLIPLLMVMIVNMVLYIMIARTFRQVAMRRGLLSYHQRQEEGLLRRKAALYQGVFCICWLPSVILGIISFTDGYSMEDNYWLLVMQAVLGPLQGILNSILYGWKRDSFRRALSERSSLLSTNRSNTMSEDTQLPVSSTRHLDTHPSKGYPQEESGAFVPDQIFSNYGADLLAPDLTSSINSCSECLCQCRKRVGSSASMDVSILDSEEGDDKLLGKEEEVPENLEESIKNFRNDNF